MYHNIHGFGKQDGIDSSHLELYFYDDDPVLEHHFHKCRMDQQQKDREVITMLVSILKGNPYSEVLQIMGQLEDADEYRISLNLDPQKDQRTYNLLVALEVLTVWVEGQGLLKQFDSSVCLHGKDQQITRIQSYNVSYDPLSYPLFFHKENQGGTLIFQRPNSGMRMCLRNLQEGKQGVSMMLVEVSVNLYYFGFHIKGI
jgi:hypothetical protein